MTQLKINDPHNLPIRSEYNAWARLVELTCVEPATVAELLEMGWIDPVRTGADEYLFRTCDVYASRNSCACAATWRYPTRRAASSWTCWSAWSAWSRSFPNSSDCCNHGPECREPWEDMKWIPTD